MTLSCKVLSCLHVPQSHRDNPGDRSVLIAVILFPETCERAPGARMCLHGTRQLDNAGRPASDKLSRPLPSSGRPTVQYHDRLQPNPLHSARNTVL
jgi:hypothetical protein